MESVLDWIYKQIELLFPHVAILAMPLMLGVMVILALILLICRKWKWGVIVLIAAVVVNTQTETFAIGVPWDNSKDVVTILTYNMLSSSDYMKEYGDNPSELYEMLINEKADVICLQEYDTVVCRLLKEKLDSDYPYFALMPKMHQESAVFSKLSIKDFKQVEGILVNEVSLDMKSRVVDLFVCHFSSNRYEGIRKEMGDSLQWRDGVGRYFTGIKTAGEKRSVEAMAVREKVDSCVRKGMPVIVCGDMNDVGGSRTLNILQKGRLLSDAWWEKGFGLGTTYHGHHVMHFRLDHILHTKELKCRKVKVVKQEFSDHDPIVAEFAMN